MAQDAGSILDYLIGGLGHLEHELAPLHLTSSQFIVVIGAMRKRARTVNEFCQFAGIDAGPMSRLLDRLQAKGIVQCVRDDLDRHQVNVELTPKGSVLYPQIMELITRVYGQFLHGFSPAEAARLQVLLQ